VVVVVAGNRLIRRRTAEAGVRIKRGCHVFRATGITAYLEAGGRLENAQALTAFLCGWTRREVAGPFLLEVKSYQRPSAPESRGISIPASKFFHQVTISGRREKPPKRPGGFPSDAQQRVKRDDGANDGGRPLSAGRPFSAARAIS
jgi:hypothetical protein